MSIETTTATTTTTTTETEDQRIERIRTDARRVLDCAINECGWRQTSRRQGRVYLRNEHGVTGWVDLQRGEINANLWFVMQKALRAA